MSTRKPSYKLVIVESPAKARTISKFLGRSYKVEASQGHVRDLPKSQLGVDVEHDFEPKYITIRGRGEVLERIRKEAKGAKSIGLSSFKLCNGSKDERDCPIYYGSDEQVIDAAISGYWKVKRRYE